MSSVRVFKFDLVKQGVALVAGIVGTQVGRPMATGQVFVLAQIHERKNIARLVEVAALVGDPHLDSGDVDTARYQGQTLAPLVIVVAEEMAEEEVPVLVILIGRDVKCRGL